MMGSAELVVEVMESSARSDLRAELRTLADTDCSKPAYSARERRPAGDHERARALAEELGALQAYSAALHAAPRQVAPTHAVCD
jgi:hypothetical protein